VLLILPNTRIKPPPARDGCFVSCPTPAVGLNELLGDPLRYTASDCGGKLKAEPGRHNQAPDSSPSS
jgi:hypothetical protein